MTPRNRSLVLATLAVTVAGLTPRGAAAHDLRAKVTVLPDAIRVEAGFDDDTPAEGARVRVTAAAGGREVAAGTTDERGVCLLPALPEGEYTATVEGLGHRDAVTFRVGCASGETEFTAWRLDKQVGLAIGLLAILGGTLMFWWGRRPMRPGAEPTPPDPPV